jgi:hypothetical protein
MLCEQQREIQRPSLASLTIEYEQLPTTSILM